VEELGSKFGSAFDVPVERLEGVGPERGKLLRKLGIGTIGDLLFHFPHRYEDRSQLTPLAQLAPGELVTCWGTIVGVDELRPRANLTILKVLLNDGTDQAWAVWFNQAYLKRSFTAGAKLIVYGRVSMGRWEKTITVEDYEKFSSSENIASGQGIVPVYPLTKGISKKIMRRIMSQAIKEYLVKIPDTLPDVIRAHYKLPGTGEALKQIHCPDSIQQAERARKSLAYEELLLWQLRLCGERTQWEQQEGIPHLIKGSLTMNFIRQLPFPLTQAQKRVLTEIFNDMEQNAPMARLLQGDVGSGKTVIAVLALLRTIENGYQGALMVPTEILAEQHYLKIKDQMDRLGVETALLTSSLAREEKERIGVNLKNGAIKLVIGTHALIQAEVQFADLGLVVIDEQHRFGVSQRAELLAKGLGKPDLLIMTATPIPRTLALTFYGDLDYSVIDQLPPGRLPVVTRYVPERDRQKAYEFITELLRQGQQAYVVCPLVEDSDKIEAEAAIELFQELQQGAFASFRLGLVYGRMPSQEKELIMEQFRQGDIHVLVATTVIEVGVDVPNANIILINGCERFGLAQLHQLRGRVGRGSAKSYCLLMGRLKSKEAKARIKAMLAQNDGFALAEEDLKLRGPGDFFGVRQHGMPEFKAADLLRDHQILQLAQKDARRIAQRRDKPEFRQLWELAQQRFAEFSP
jgi:ATP-dependent DNA helicase RecG